MPDEPPFTITQEIFSQIAGICELIGWLDGRDWGSRSPYLRKDNRIESIHSSLAIENNTLSLDEVAAIIDGKKVLGLKREIQEVQNAFTAYESLDSWRPDSIPDFLKAHQMLLREIKDDSGKFRSGDVGIYQGDKVIHMAPPADRVHALINSLFTWQKTTKAHLLIVGAVVHYEIEFIHPFSDGNGRMGRLWQTLILSRWNPEFAFLPVESVIHREQQSYYAALAESDAKGNATPFIEFILSAIITALRRAKSEVSATAIDQVSDQVSDQVKSLLMTLLENHELNADKLLTKLSLKHRPTFRKNYLTPALDADWVEMTQPDSPRSPTQKYRLTNAGTLMAKAIKQSRRA